MALSLLKWFGQVRHIVLTALLVGVQCLMNDLYKALEGPSTRSIVLSIITGSYLRRRRRVTILESDETKFASHLTLLCRLGHRRRSDERFLQNYILGFDTSANFDKSSEYNLKKFTNVFEACVSSLEVI